MDLRKRSYKGVAAAAQVIVLSGLAVLWVGSPAFAGVADAPPPVLGGQSSTVMFIVPGVVRHSNLRTEFLCTSLDTLPFTFAVEVFNASGFLVNKASDPISNGAQTLGPGETRTVATGGTLALHEDTVIEPVCIGGDRDGGLCECPGGTCNNGVCSDGTACPLNLNCTNNGTCSTIDVGNGSARIVSTSRKITCSAFVTDKLNSPPTGMVSLKMISRKQKGE